MFARCGFRVVSEGPDDNPKIRTLVLIGSRGSDLVAVADPQNAAHVEGREE